MNFSGVGGITIAVVAMLWFFVFIPSWFNASANRAETKKQTRSFKRAVAAAKQPIVKAPKTRISSLSEQVYRAERGIRVFKFLTWMFALSAGALGLALNKFDMLTPYVVVCAVLAVASLRALFMAKSAQQKLLVGSIRSRRAVAGNAGQAAIRDLSAQAAQVQLAKESFQKIQAEREAWTQAIEAERVAKQFVAQTLPAPSYAAQVGSLEEPNFAPVVDLGDKAATSTAAAVEAQSVDAATINDILRRRRAVGE